MGLYGLYGAAVLLSVQDREHRQGRVRRPLTEGGQAIKKYSIIYADPPWQYKVYSKKGAGRSAESHYPTMSIEDIRALPVSELADRDCALFLWITFPMLLDALSVIKAWGFTYKTVAFAWVKQNKKANTLFWGSGLLDTGQCGAVHPGDQGTAKAEIRRRSSSGAGPGGGTQQETRYCPG